MQKTAILENITLDDTKQRLLTLRDWWKNDIPDEMVHSSSPDRFYKVRTGWFQGIIGCILRYQQLEQSWQIPLSSAIQKEFLDFYALTVGTKFSERRHTNEDIRKWDELINKILADIEKILSIDSNFSQ